MQYVKKEGSEDPTLLESPRLAAQLNALQKYIFLYLPMPPYISLHLPRSPYISPPGRAAERAPEATRRLTLTLTLALTLTLTLTLALALTLTLTLTLAFGSGRHDWGAFFSFSLRV